MRSLRRAIGALSAVLLAAAALSAASLTAAAPAARASSAKAQPPLAISITGMNPTIAVPGATIRVSGTLANHTGAPLLGISVQGWTSSSSFQYPAQMTDFTGGTSAGTSPLQLTAAGEQYEVPDSVPNGATVRWTVAFQADAFYSQFGDFPVQVQAQSAGGSYSAFARTLLPFWPGSGTVSEPKGLQVAWVWPLVDLPQQGACPQTLATSRLAASVASGGRLATLLDAGSTWAQTDDLTWNIDPALLSDVSVMTKPYFTQGSYDCSGRFPRKPSQAAASWLSQLKAATAGSPAFTTPYADVDAAALSRSGLDANLEAAYQLGDSVAGRILPNTFGKNSAGTGDGTVLKAAWPADGWADAGVLTSLADDGGISTVVLSSDELSPSAPGEDALAKTISGVGTSMSVLVANARITSLLAAADKASSPSGQFSLTQNFLAQTAMIAAEAPNTERSLVIAPPSRWSPSPAAANALLSITHNAPWLHSTGLADLAKAAAQLPSTTRVPPKKADPGELKDQYTDKIASVSGNVAVFKDLLYKPAADQLSLLDAALAGTESSAWRGRGSYGGWLATGQLSGYLNDAENKVSLIVSKKILLAGQSGETAVSVQNGLGQPVQVRVTASTPLGSDVHAGPLNSPLTVPARGSNTVRMPVHSSALGTSTIQLQLTTASGLPLTSKGAAQSLSVEVTRVGRFLLLIIGGALGILVLTSAYRLRRKRLAGAKSDGTDDTAAAGGTG